MNLLNVNGPLMNELRKFGNLVICNILFCVFSLPIVTAGASLTALYTCIQAILIGDEDDIIAKQFWKAFKQNFKQATVLWLFCLVIAAMLGVYYLVISGFGGTLLRIYRISFFMMCIVFLFGYQYLFPMQARYRNTVKNTIKNAWLLSIAALPWTILSIALVVGAVYLSFFMNPNAANVFIFLWGMVGFGLIAYLNSFFFQKAFKLIDPEVMEVKHTVPKEAVFTDEEHRTTEVFYQESTFSNPDWNRQPIPGGSRDVEINP